MWSYSGDPIRDAEARDAEQQAALDKLPVCYYCGEPIQDDFCYEINDEIICEECLNANFRKQTDDLID
jgi:formylmethanofuran dehydrogenase subunit E